MYRKPDTVPAIRGSEKLKHPVKAPGVEVKECDAYCWRWIYSGSSESLISAGLTRPEWLPGTPGSQARMQFSIIVAGRQFRNIRRHDGKYFVQVGRSDREQEAVQRKRHAERDQKTAAEVARAAVNKAWRTTCAIRSFVCGWHWRHEGSPEQLLAAGLIKGEWLALCERGSERVFVEDGRLFSIYRRTSSDTVRVDIETLHDEPGDKNWPPEVDLDDYPDLEYDAKAKAYIGTPLALIESGFLRPEDIPGNPRCPNRWAYWSRRNGRRFEAIRVGRKISFAFLDC